MDGGGRLARSLTGLVRRKRRASFVEAEEGLERPSRFALLAHRVAARVVNRKLPRASGWIATGVLFAATAGYGVVTGGHVETVRGAALLIRHQVANALGFKIDAVSIAGNRHFGGEEVFETVGITDRTSLPFLDVDAARARLMENPWIVQATVQKLYPNRLAVTLVEREPFALWQQDGEIQVIAADGRIIAPYNDPRYSGLPFVVGKGAETRAQAFYEMLDRFPAIREKTRAAIYVAERRWTLRLKNGIDIRLPEEDPAAALAQLEGLDKARKLTTRDVLAIDMRLPDRVSLLLTPEAAVLRDQAVKERKPKAKPKGGDYE